VKHSPDAVEQQSIDTLLERFNFEFVPVRLTETMLDKSIIDARGPLRAYLARTGLVDFGAIPQGTEHKVQVPVPFVSADHAESRIASFYRPSTKQGDPRVWIERLKSAANPGDLLLFAFAGVDVLTILVRGNPESLAERLDGLLPSQFELRGQLENTVNELSGKLARIRGEWIQTRRAGPTGVGYTLEDLIGIEANVRQIADVDGVELKAYRRGALSGAGKLVTLFSKTPHWVHPDQGIGLLRRYGYRDERRGRRALYCTIVCTPNSLGWQLQFRSDGRRVYALRSKEEALHYSFSTLEKRLKEKHPATLFIQASARGSGRGEEFRYEDVMLCRAPSFSNFLDLAAEDFIGLDLTLSEKENGVARDHGYLWRIREPKIPELFGYRRALL
jgi:hypothetical protein